MSQTDAQAAGDLSNPPAAAWVRFLRSYGPTPNNLTMFDEYVSSALGRARVAPIALSTPLLDAMVLVRRLSDSCSFVENPFSFKGAAAC